MTIYTDTNALSAPYSNGVGNAYSADGIASVPSTFTTTDKARLLKVPAGTRITHLDIRNTDLDTGTVITANFGYEAANSGSTLTAAPTYFGSALTILRGAARTAMSFAPITFDEDVWITCIPQAGPADTAGTIQAIALGNVVGVK